jgi:cathepsin E
MAPAVSFVLSALLATYVAATPVADIVHPKISISKATKFNSTVGFRIVDVDRARIAKFKSQASLVGPTPAAGSSSFPVTNIVDTYVASVGVGSPPSQYSLLIDTGSSNTWLGATKKYVVTSTSVKTSNKVSVSYGSGSFSGTEYTDTVTLSSSLVITKQSIGVASTSSDFTGLDGILGVGPVALTQGTLSPGTNTLIPTVTDNLFSQGTISSNVLGIFYAPTTSQSTANGELTFGGTDTTKITTAVAYSPVTTTSPASLYWGINQSVAYGTTTIMSTTAGIVDTGTTLIYLPTDAYNKYVSATGATLDNNTGLLKVSSVTSLKSLFFTMGGVAYELTANAQQWPHALNTAAGGTASGNYLVVQDIGSVSGTGLDFITGYTFLERYYSVFDTGAKRIGFAQTANTFATSN